MAKYLVVTHQTALSPALQQTVRALAAKDSAAEFAVLVPEAPQGATTWEGETVDGAKQRGEAAKTLFEDTAQARVFRIAARALERKHLLRVERKFGRRVIHVVAEAPVKAHS